MEHAADKFFSTSGPLQCSQYYCHHEICEHIHSVSEWDCYSIIYVITKL